MSEVLPPSATPLLRGIDAAAARITRIPAGPLSSLWDPDRCPLSHLPWLAWAFGLDDFDAGWPEALQRAQLRAARRKHELRGTWAAVRAELQAIGAVWGYSEGPAPMTGTVLIHNGNSIPTRSLADLRARLRRVKRASFHLTIALRTGVRAEIRIGGAAGSLSPRRADVAFRAPAGTGGGG